MSDEEGGTRELWGIPTSAHYLRLSENALRCRIKRGQFPKGTLVYVGRSVRFVATRLNDWVFKQSA